MTLMKWNKEVPIMKKWFESFLKKIEAANKESFGSQRMDCCDLNSKDSTKSAENTEKKQQASS